MSDIIKIDNVKTISSIELCDLINKIRKEEGVETTLLHKNLLAKIKDELDLDKNESRAKNLAGVYLDKQNQERLCYNLPQKEALQVIASESKRVRRRLINEIERLTMENTQLQQSVASYMIQDPIERAKKWIEEQEEHRRIEQEQQQKINDYRLTIEKKIDKQQLFAKINRMIRQKAKDVFDSDYSKAYNYYYQELSDRHCFIHRIDMKFLKNNIEYAKELLEMLLNND